MTASPPLALVRADVRDPELSERLWNYWRDLGADPAPEWHQRYLRRLAEQDGHDRYTFWGQVGHQRVGLVIVRTEPDWLAPERRIGYIVEFTVFRPWRLQGFGRALYRRAREYLAAQGCAWVELDVLPANQTGMAFWRAMGFQIAYHHMREVEWRQ